MPKKKKAKKKSTRRRRRLPKRNRWGQFKRGS
jgi:hypothetical protein